MVKNMIEISMLYDFYGELLTQKQKSIMQYYYGDDYSLAEIAAETGISRQAVYDTVRKAEKSLHGYEEKLGLVSRFMRTAEELANASERLDEIIGTCDEKTADRLRAVKEIIDSMEDEL